jgi:hypothetical protein
MSYKRVSPGHPQSFIVSLYPALYSCRGMPTACSSVLTRHISFSPFKFAEMAELYTIL